MIATQERDPIWPSGMQHTSNFTLCCTGKHKAKHQTPSDNAAPLKFSVTQIKTLPWCNKESHMQECSAPSGNMVNMTATKEHSISGRVESIFEYMHGRVPKWGTGVRQGTEGRYQKKLPEECTKIQNAGESTGVKYQSTTTEEICWQAIRRRCWKEH